MIEKIKNAITPTKKVIIFDASTLISLSMNGLFNEIVELKKVFKGKFIIPKEVKEEIIDKPLTIKRFELEAIRLQKLLDDKVLELPSSMRIDDATVSKKTSEMLALANDVFVGRGKSIKIIGFGETACLALSRILDEKGIKNVIAVDERTTRMLGEKPENLEQLLQKKLHMKITTKKKNFGGLGKFRFIRSAELVYIAWKKGIVKIKHENLLDALLYAVKFKGCSINDDEIREIKSINKNS